MKILLIFLVLATTNGYNIYEGRKYFHRPKRSYYGVGGGGGGGDFGHYGFNNLDLAASSGPSFKIGLDDLKSLLAVPPSPVASRPAEPPAEPPAPPAPPSPPMEGGGGGGGGGMMAQGPPPGQTATVQLPAFVPISLSAMYSAGPAAAPPAPPAPEPPAPEPPAAAPAPAPPAPEPPAAAPPSEIIRNIITTFEIRKPIPIQVPIPKPIYIPRPVPIISAPLPPPISTFYTVRGPIYKHHGGWR